jgi:hypothetical protein
MTEQPRSNRPTPRTPAAIEAELRRRIRTDLTQARADADGELDDAALAAVIARAISNALGWHVEAPEHTRNATLSSRTWRSAGGPRAGGGGRPPREFEDRDYDERRPPPPPPPPYRDRYERDERFERREEFDDRDRDRDYRPPPRGPRPPGPRGGYGGFSGGRGGGKPVGKRGGFGPRRPPKRAR